MIGADFLVNSATEIAAISGVPEAVISATIVAVGTSLPELVTTVSAVIKKQSSLSVGNIIGANLIDIAIILPICSLVSGGELVACPQNLFLDIPICLGLLVLALVPMLIKGKFGIYSRYDVIAYIGMDGKIPRIVVCKNINAGSLDDKEKIIVEPDLEPTEILEPEEYINLDKKCIPAPADIIDVDTDNGFFNNINDTDEENLINE